MSSKISIPLIDSAITLMWMLQTVDFSPCNVFLLNSEVPFQVSSTGTVWLDQRLHSLNTSLCFKYKEKEA